jgi:demethylmenaquinone methyltransferase/2-methoxy-6-polyprenyl-1,4-benzoquinol methylase
MNDLMSFGLHHRWKRDLVDELYPLDGTLLDVAGGTGDIAAAFLKRGGLGAIICDLNPSMLAAGKKKRPQISSLNWIQGNAEQLPFEDNSFALCTISFGIRNVTNIDKALAEMYRVLKPGGKFLCLEFSDVSLPIIKKIYDFYSLKWIPFLGSLIAKDKDAYSYLVESIRKFPNAELFSHMIEEAGFESVWFSKKTFGVVAIHTGYKT